MVEDRTERSALTAELQQRLTEAGYTPDQIFEIVEGTVAGVDVSLYQDRDLFAIQMRQIRMGLMEGLPAHLYADKCYDWFQMEEIRKGLEDGIDISLYASPDVSYDRMRQIREGLKEGFDLSPYKRLDAGILRELRKARTSRVNIVEYINQGYATEQLEQIRIALEKGIEIQPYLVKELRGVSIAEICAGLERGIDVSIYASIDYSWQQMREIRLGLENRIDINQYVNPLYSWQQMREIRLGLEAGLDVSSFRSLMYTATDMCRKRLMLQNGRHVGQLGTTPSVVETEDFRITITKDEMEAHMEVLRENPGLTKEYLKQQLEQAGVQSGILDSSLQFLAGGTHVGRSVPVARGSVPRDGTDGWYEYFFDTEQKRVPRELEDGSVDYQNMQWLEVVQEGQTLAYYHPAADGIPGTTVTGKTLDAKRGREQPLLAGKGFEVLGDQRTYQATVSGRIEKRDDYIEIVQMLVVDEMNLSTGNIYFDGSVYVRGNIGNGVSLEATGDVLVDGFVEAASVVSGGNILLRQGMNASGRGEGYVHSQKTIRGKFFEGVKIEAQGDVFANYCLNCELHAGGKMIISGQRGSFAGGQAFAAKGIEAYNLGNRAGIVTYIEMGIKDDLIKKKQQLEGALKEVQKELNIFENAYLDFQKKYPPEVRNSMDIYVKIESAIYTKEQQQGNIYEDIQQVMDQIQEVGRAKAVVRGVIHEGVVVSMNGEHWKGRENQNVILKYKEGRIVSFLTR